MKRILLVLSRGGMLQNFYFSGVLPGLLERGINIVVLTPPTEEVRRVEALLSGQNVIFEELGMPTHSFMRQLLRELQYASIFNDTVRARYTYTIASKIDPSSALYYPRRYLFPLLRFFPFIKQVVRWLVLWCDPQKEYDHLFSRYTFDLVFSTTPHDESDSAVLKSARRSRVPTLAFPKSWDNVSKILFPVKTDHVLVWGSYMRDEIIKIQGYHPGEVMMTGSPQFDIYASTQNLWSREDFVRRYKLDPKKSVIFYGSSGADMCDEAQFLDLLKKYISHNPSVQVLVRPHPGYARDRDRYARFMKEPGFVVDTSIYQSRSERSVWDTNPERQQNLCNSLAHSDVCVNVVSTLTIDALLAGTPVINLQFDVDPNVDPFRRSVKRLFETAYAKAIISVDATHVVRNQPEFFRALDALLAGKDSKEGARELLIERFAYKNDGHSARRVVEAVDELLR